MFIPEVVLQLPPVAYLIAHWEAIKGFFDSSFTSALLGAGFGAWGAQHIAERSKGREQLLTEMKATNAARSVVLQILNSLFAVKGQQYRPMKRRFDQQKDEYLSLVQGVKLGTIPPGVVYTPKVDLRSLGEVSVPIQTLQTYVYEKINSSGKALALTGTITESLYSINTMLRQRQDVINSYKTDAMYLSYEAQVYFGIPIPSEHYHNTMYTDLLTGINDQTDNVIFFSLLLNDDLLKHGLELEKLYKKEYGKGAISPVELSFAVAERNNLIPHPLMYMDWLTGFRKRPEKKSAIRNFFTPA